MGTMDKGDCLICNSRSWEGLLKLKSMPSYTGCSKKADEKRRELEIIYCRSCGLIKGRKPLSFDENRNINKICYPSTRIIEQKIREDKAFYDFLQGQGAEFKNILEIGCHDGHFLSLFSKNGARLFGCEPSYYAKFIGKNKNISVIQAPFKASLYKGQKFDLIIMRNLLNVVKDPYSMVKDAALLLDKNGHLAVENINIAEFLYQDVIPRFSHELRYYFSPDHIKILMSKAGVSVVEQISGRRVYFFAKKAQRLNFTTANAAFKRNIRRIKKYKSGHLKNALMMKRKFGLLADEWRRKKYRVAFYGAGSFAQSILAFFNIDDSQISCLVDSDPFKKGNYLKGTSLRISGPAVLKKQHFDIIAITSFYQNEIVRILKNLKLKSRILVFYPKIKYLSDRS